MKYQLEILLSTFNGAEFLHEQIDSLLSQSFKDWRLCVRDDGSTDDTLKIIDNYVSLHPDKIFLMQDGLGNIGASQSFSTLMSYSKASYVALCDQDDVWCSNKLMLQMNKIHEEEGRLGIDLPLLINTDLQVTDQFLNILSPSLWEYQNIDPVKMHDLHYLLVQNHVTGCTVLMNRALINSLLPISENAIMHDWWLVLVASAKGGIISLNEATVLYRQHELNDIGAKKWNIAFILKGFFSGAIKSRGSLTRSRRQAVALLNSGLIGGDSEVLIEKYVNMFEKGWFERRNIMLKEAFFKKGVVRNLAMFLYI